MNQNNNNGLSLLDAISIVSFLIGLANYDENMSQSDVQEIIQNALNDIHGHLREQDEKIEHIIELLEVGK